MRHRQSPEEKAAKAVTRAVEKATDVAALAVGKRLFDLLNDMPPDVNLTIGNMGENVTLEFIDGDGDMIESVCPLIEIEPDGTLVEQVYGGSSSEVGPIEALEAALAY